MLSEDRLDNLGRCQLFEEDRTDNLGRCCRLFEEDRTDVHDEELSGRPSLVTDELKEKVNAKTPGEKTIHIFSI